MISRLFVAPLLVGLMGSVVGCEPAGGSTSEIDDLVNECRAGETSSCAEAARRFYFASGMEFNPEEALSLSIVACEGLIADSCANAGSIYQSGTLGQTDFVQAARYFDIACNLGSGNGCYGLGLMHWEGSGVEVDTNETLRLFTLSCDLEDAQGCLGMGRIFALGMIGETDFERAIENYSAGCLLELSDACRELGVILPKASHSMQIFPVWRAYFKTSVTMVRQWPAYIGPRWMLEGCTKRKTWLAPWNTYSVNASKITRSLVG